MAITSVAIQQAAPTTAGTQNFTASGFGTPTAAILIYSLASSGSNPTDGAVISIGFIDVDQPRTLGQGISHNHGVSTANTSRVSSSSSAIIANRLTTTVAPRLVDVEYVGTVTDGIQLNWATVTGTADYLTVYLLKGTTNVHADTVSLTGTSIDITAPGFKPDLVIVTNVGNSTDNSSAVHSIFSFGASHNNSSDVVSNALISIASTNGAGTDVVNASVRNDACATQTFNGTVTYRTSCTAFDASGFTFTSTGAPGNDYLHYIAIKGDSPDDFYVGVVDTPTSTGDQGYTGLGFTPQLLLLGQTLVQTVNSLISNADAGSFSVGGTDATNEYSNGIALEDAASTMNTQSSATTAAISKLYLGDGSAASHEATLSSFDADGFTLNYTTTAAAARKWMAISIAGVAAPGGLSIPIAAYHYNHSLRA